MENREVVPDVFARTTVEQVLNLKTGRDQSQASTTSARHESRWSPRNNRGPDTVPHRLTNVEEGPKDR